MHLTCSRVQLIDCLYNRVCYSVRRQLWHASTFRHLPQNRRTSAWLSIKTLGANIQAHMPSHTSHFQSWDLCRHATYTASGWYGCCRSMCVSHTHVPYCHFLTRALSSHMPTNNTTCRQAAKTSGVARKTVALLHA